MDLFPIEKKIVEVMWEYWHAAQEAVRDLDDRTLVELIHSNKSGWSGGISAKNFCEQTVREAASAELKRRAFTWDRE